MPVTYTNRKGVTYMLFRVQTTAGQTRYVVGQRSKGQPVDELPPGFRFSESPNGVVSLVRERPQLILPEETATVETLLGQLPRGEDYRVVTKHNRIEVYAKVGPNVVDIYHEMLADDLVLPGRDSSMQELEELWARFVPVLRFVLTDSAERWFSADHLVTYRDISEWVWTGQEGELDALAAAIVPSLATEATTDPFAALDPIATVGWPVLAPGAAAVRSVRTRKSAPPASVHRLKVTLRGSRPPIWRRFVVASDVTLAELHDIVQIVMGWHDEHLHLFRVGAAVYGDLRYLDDLGDRDERRFRLDQVAPQAKTRLRYEYDFGDSWEHEILVEAVGPPESGARYPICLAGKRACPPEDCGGLWGYSHFVEAVNDRKHRDYADMREWWGGPFDAEAFDPEQINRWLAQPGLRWRES
jgi:hypothetical protein